MLGCHRVKLQNEFYSFSQVIDTTISFYGCVVFILRPVKNKNTFVTHSSTLHKKRSETKIRILIYGNSHKADNSRGRSDRFNLVKNQSRGHGLV
jgi:hypothetical protein